MAAPEDLTPAAPAAPPAPEDIVTALLAFATHNVTNPTAQLGLSLVTQYAQQHQSELAGILGGSGPLTVRGVIDTVFQFVEGKARRPFGPFVRFGLVALNDAIDVAGLPALQLYLASVGIPLPIA